MIISPSTATEELSNVLTSDNRRVRNLLEAIQRIVLDPGRMRALGFCVSKEHVRYMARMFTQAGLESVALTGDDPPDVRDHRLRDLKEGRLRCVFSVEVLGEGVDVPDVDTVFLLRPTASATIFTQQLGRGLRRARDKSSLTVIDLIGQQHREFRFEDRLRAILDARRGPIKEQVENQFPFLPAGCTVDLDRQSRDIILDNLKAAVRRSRWTTLVADLRLEAVGVGLGDFLDRHDLRLEDVYRGGHSWTELQRDARHPTASPVDSELERRTLRALGRMTHLDDPERVGVYRRLLDHASPPNCEGRDERERRLLTMLAWDLGSSEGTYSSLGEYFERLWLEDAPRRELSELLILLDERSNVRSRPSELPPEVPLTVHGRYTRAEAIAALGFADGVKPKVTQGGILWVPQAKSDVFFIDLRKAERDYSPTTMYRDYAITRELFHWESQSRQHPAQETVRRYIGHQSRGTKVLLFVREKKTFELGTQPFTFLGPAKYVSHEGERPVAFTWRLAVPMPEELFEVARSVAAA